MVKNLSADAGDARVVGLIPGSGRPPGVGSGNLLQYSCLENSMDRRDLRATVHQIAKSQTQQSEHARTNGVVLSTQWTSSNIGCCFYLLLQASNPIPARASGEAGGSKSKRTGLPTRDRNSPCKTALATLWFPPRGHGAKFFSTRTATRSHTSHQDPNLLSTSDQREV